MPRVSVLIAAYNSAPFIGETLDSVLAQSYDDWEVVVADDASVDETPSIARGYGERVRVVVAAANSGRPAATRALALSHARGELVAFLDADDLWQPSYLTSMTRLLDGARERDRRVAIAACDASLLKPDGTIASRTYADYAGRPAQLTLGRLLASNPIYTSALVCRGPLEDAGGIAVELSGTDDWDLWLRMMELGHRVVWTDQALATYRLRSDSMSADHGLMARNVIDVCRRALARGRLTRRQRRLVHRQLHIQRFIEAREAIRARRRAGDWALADRVRLAPLAGRVFVENIGRTTARSLRGFSDLRLRAN